MRRFLCIAMSVLSLAYLPVLGFGIGVCALTTQQGSRYAEYFVSDGARQGNATRNVYYTSKTIEDYVNPYEAPSFKAGRVNTCVVDAGGNVMVYYDRIFDELVPDYKHKYVWGVFTYSSQNEGVNKMFDTLYDMMGTTNDGTNIPGFKKGMKAYTASRGHDINLMQVTGSYHNVNIEGLKKQLKAEKPAVIFLNTYSVTAFGGIEENVGHDIIKHSTYSGTHAMVVYGFKDIYYYDEDARLKQRDTFLYVSTGIGSLPLAMVDITRLCTVDDIYITEVI